MGAERRRKKFREKNYIDEEKEEENKQMYYLKKYFKIILPHLIQEVFNNHGEFFKEVTLRKIR